MIFLPLRSRQKAENGKFDNTLNVENKVKVELDVEYMEKGTF
jgi:hypothetical protein